MNNENIELLEKGFELSEDGVESSEEDIELSEEDVEFFKIYEKTPRSNKAWIFKGPTKLPIKLPDGKIKHQEPDDNSNNETDENEEDSSSDSDNNNYDEDLQDDMEVDEFNSSQNTLSDNDAIQKKEELAAIAQMIVEDPENNIGQLKVLRKIATNNNLKIKKLAILTQLVVYKDIIPGCDFYLNMFVFNILQFHINHELNNYRYRIRQLTDKEKAAKVSEEVRKLRHFEQSLVSNYQAYLKSLEAELKEELTMKTLNDKNSVNDKTKGKKRKFDKQESKKKLSKKLRKLDKERRGVEKEMKEAEAVVNREEREKRTLKLVFITYFRILKHANSSPLLVSALEGLAKFAHLINVDFFNDLLELLKKLMLGQQIEDNYENSCKRIDTRKSLLCIITAFHLLSGQDLDDPELCNPLATNLWELSLLENHYDPKIRAMATSLATYIPDSEKSM
ncbi:154_t:CDS:2 [Scutellospora calospora]|uniref:154_t:CDS:1 n=1 Tax=Scutellospora calospora TaxID=85575 RepID=A0ACA9L1J1_9GLOM|nr:154_t:CDS:2 [Scutellospora calospora]